MLSWVDSKAKNSKGHLIIVEVQLTRQLFFLQRILYGRSKTITEHINNCIIIWKIKSGIRYWLTVA